MRAYSYIRFSRESQLQGDSLRRQTSLAEDWCEQHGVPLVDDYRDLGVSGFKGKNADEGALGAFLSAVQSGKVRRGDYLLVESLDRIGRTQVNRAMAVLLQIINAGVIVVTLGADQREYREDSPDLMVDLIMSLVLMSRAHEESATKSRRVASAWAKKREDAKEGKIVTKRGPSWLKLVEDRWEAIPHKVALVREIFQMSVNGKSIGSITKELNGRGEPTLSEQGEHWHTSTVANVLDSRAVIGEYAPRVRDGSVSCRTRATVCRDYFPRIISDETFDRARRYKVGRSRGRGRKSPNVFRGILFDADGIPYHYTQSKSGKAKRVLEYLRTYNADRGIGGWHSWRYDHFLKDFLAKLEAHLESTNLSAQGDARIETLRAEIADCDSQITNLTMVLARRYSDPVDKALQALEERRAAAHESLEREESIQSGRTLQLDVSDPEELAATIRAHVALITMDARERTWVAELIGGGEFRSENAP